jgi:guanylate kinase
VNELKHIAEFRELLADYKLSPSAAKTLEQVKLVLLVAPTATGRNATISELLKRAGYYFIVSDTTRKPRMNNGILEESGREYWFRSEEEMLEEIRRGEFLEAAIIHNQQVSGISIRELDKARKQKKIAVTDAEIAGAENATHLKPDTIAMFMLPPSFEEWQRRIALRGTMELDEYKRRMTSACKEFEAALSHAYYRFVINESVEQAAAVVDRIARTGVVDPLWQEEGRNLAQRLLDETRKALAKL